VDKVDDEIIRDQLDKITKLGKKLRTSERQLKKMNDPISPKDFMV